MTVCMTVLFHLFDKSSVRSVRPAYPRISDDGEGAVVGGTARGGKDREQDQQEYGVNRVSSHGFGGIQLTVFLVHTQLGWTATVMA